MTGTGPFFSVYVAALARSVPKIDTLHNNSICIDSLAGKVAVVTGSTGGIGRAIALEMARHGAHVIIHGRQRQPAEQVLKDLAAVSPRSDVNHAVHLSDLADPTTHEKLVEAAWASSLVLGGTGVDAWVNNAGVDVLTGAVANRSFEEKLQQLWQVDVLATIRLSRLVARRMKSRGGSIVNIGWDQAEWGMAGESGEMFATIKGAVMAFTRSLARTAAPNVRVNCVAPGWIKTKWGERAGPYWDVRAQAESLLGRWGNPDDVARAVRFLASSESAFINGQTINVNGGSQPWPVGWPDDHSRAEPHD